MTINKHHNFRKKPIYTETKQGNIKSSLLLRLNRIIKWFLLKKSRQEISKSGETNHDFSKKAKFSRQNY